VEAFTAYYDANKVDDNLRYLVETKLEALRIDFAEISTITTAITTIVVELA
jgi:hypothetical protein